MSMRTLGALFLGAALSGGCAKDATSILVNVGAEADVPPILILRSTIVRSEDTNVRSSAERSSNAESDAADRPGPFVFPFQLSLTVDQSFGGAVTVIVEGLDWDTHTVIAAGSTAATVVAQKATDASLTLSAAPVADR